MMESEPSEYVCLECSLRFKNSGTFEKHKRKFCQAQGRHDKTWSPSVRSNRNFLNGQPDVPIKSAASGEFWSKKPNTGQIIGLQGKQQMMNSPKSSISHSYGNLNQIGADMKFNSVLDDLRFEQEKLEEHKRAIQEKLTRIQGDRRTNRNQANVAYGQMQYQSSQRERKERNGLMEARLLELQNSMLRRNQSGKSNRKNSYLYSSSPWHENGNTFLAHLKTLKRQYIEDGGDDTRIFEMIHSLENEVYRDRRSSPRRENTVVESETVKQLQQQLLVFQQTNESLLKELEILKASKDRQQDVLKTHVNEQELVRRDVGTFHEKKLMEMKQEAEIYRQQLELERLKSELQNLRGGIPNLLQLPAIQYNQTQQQQHQQQQQEQHSMVMSERDMYQLSNGKTDEAFQPSPYDPGGGFAIFWDFICSIAYDADRCRITVTMFKDSEPVSDTKILPAVPCNPTKDGLTSYTKCSGRIAILGIKQVFPRCLPLQSLSVVIQVQLGSQRDVSFEAMEEVGWSQVEMFDSFGRVIAGRWKVPVRIPPVAPQLTSAQLNAVQQLDGCELYYRLINMRDLESQEGVVLAAQQTKSYKYPPMEHKIVPVANVSLEPRRTIISRVDSPEPRKRSTKRKQRKTPVQSPEYFSPQPVISPPAVNPTPSEEPTLRPVIPTPAAVPIRNQTPKQPTPVLEPSPQPQIPEIPREPDVSGRYFVGFQFDKLYDVHEATARLQVTIYRGNGKVARCEGIPATKRSLYCRTPFLKSVLAFGLEEVQFEDLMLDRRSFAVIEVYAPASGGFLAVKQTEEEEEELISWTIFKLCQDSSNVEQHSRNSRNSRNSRSSRIRDQDDEEDLLKVNTGVQEVGLYSPPVLEPRQILASFKNRQIIDSCERLGPACISFYLFNKKFLPPALPSDIPLFSYEDQCPENAWVPGERTEAPAKIFQNGDGFEMYVDNGRFFPDNCAFAKIVCELYDSKYTKLKDEFESDINLDLNPHSPKFDLKFEFREFSYPPTAAILFKVFMIDSITKQSSRLGVSVLPVFVKTSTFDRADDFDSKFCLNEGHFQLRLYNELKPSERLTRSSLESPVPCASLLVRLVPAPCYPDGQPKQATDFLEDQWESEGLLLRKPPYTNGKYESKGCSPNIIECRLFHSYMMRKPTTTRDTMKSITEGRKSKNDQGLIDTIKNALKNIQNVPKADLLYLAKYNSLHGIVVSIDSAQNLPWTGFTFATYCFSPPASFYKGKLDDPAVLVTKLDLDGCIRLPKWSDGIKVFPRRRSHSNLVVIVHLYQLVLVQKEDRVEFTFGAQAWTVIPVCYQDYTYHGLFQVGIFHDTPSTAIIDQIQNEPLAETITNLRKRKTVRLVDGASVFIRIGDARRREELDDPAKLLVRKTFLPRGNKYLNPVQSKRFATIIPADQNAEEYGKVLTTKFRMLAGQEFQYRIPK